MPQVFDAIMLCEEAPVFELRDGLFHIIQRIGVGHQIERVMRPHVFLKSLRAAKRVADEFHAGRNNVVAIPDRADEADEEVRTG